MDWARVRTLAKGDRECQHYFCESPLQVPQVQPLRDQTHRELVYRSFQFQKRSQYFIGDSSDVPKPD